METITEWTYEDIFKKYYNYIYSQCFYHLGKDEYMAQEITQNVFLCLFVSWNELKNHCEPLLLSWLRNTARNMIMNHYHKKKKAPDIISYDDNIGTDEELGMSYDFEDNTETQDYATYSEEIMSHLNKDERFLYKCMVIEELNPYITARMYNINVNTVKTRWRRLKLKLEKIIKKVQI